VLNALQRAQYLLGNESAGNRYSIYLLYWYKSTNTDAAANSLELTNEEEEELAIVEVKKVVKMPGALTAQVLSLLALLVQKYKY
jgi:hypothetical protein